MQKDPSPKKKSRLFKRFKLVNFIVTTERNHFGYLNLAIYYSHIPHRERKRISLKQDLMGMASYKSICDLNFSKDFKSSVDIQKDI